MQAQRIVASGIVGFVAVVISLACGPGCERKPDSTTSATQPAPSAAGAPRAASEAGAPAAGGLEIPQAPPAELAKLGMSLEMKFTDAYHRAQAAPDDAYALGELAPLYFVHGFPAQAAPIFRRMAELKPDEISLWYFTGMSLDRAGKREEAIALYEKVLGMSQTYLPPFHRLADLLLESNPARAAELYAAALKLNPLDGRAAYGVGRALAAQGRHDEALTYYQKAVGLAPRSADAHRALAAALQAAGHKEEAGAHESLAQRGVAFPELEDPVMVPMLRKGEDTATLCQDAVAAARAGNMEAAEGLLEKVQQSGRVPAKAAEALGLVRLVQKRWDEAAQALRQAIELDPQGYSAKSALAEVMAETGELGEAERLLREVLSVIPEDASSLQRFRVVMNRQERPDEPVRVVEEAMAANPDNMMLRFQFAQLLSLAQRMDEALEQLDWLSRNWPDYFPARHMKGLILRNRGDFAAARAEWLEVLRVNPRSEESYFELLALARRAGDLAEMERLSREGVKHLPESHALTNSLAWILATSPDDQQRSGDEALELAKKACGMTSNRVPGYLDTLAAAFAETGNFSRAGEIQGKTVEMARQAKDPDAEVYAQRLELYKNKQPYRDVPAAPAANPAQP